MIKRNMDLIAWRDLNQQELISAFIDEHKDEYAEFTEREFEAFTRGYKG